MRQGLKQLRSLMSGAPPNGAGLQAELDKLQASQDEIKTQLGALRITLWDHTSLPKTIRDAEFKVFSQFGEDGIIQYLVRKLAPVPKSFIEFGVEDYRESNTRFLLLHDNWRGLIIDGSDSAIESVRRSALYWRHDLTAVSRFVDRDNINSLISQGGLAGEIGLLSVDLDGNDYWVWERITVVDPAIVIVEYNSLFGPDRAVTIPYEPGFVRTKAHLSDLYWGASLKALCGLADKKGYIFVGSNSAGNNAFFVRKDRSSDLRALSAAEGYVSSMFRESKGPRGELTFVSGDARLKLIADMPLYDLESNATIRVSELTTGR